jgi:hypothetical protein
VTYRVKLILAGRDWIEPHYFHETTLEDAERVRRELREDLAEVPNVDIWIYADTRHGHVRVA